MVRKLKLIVVFSFLCTIVFAQNDRTFELTNTKKQSKKVSIFNYDAFTEFTLKEKVDSNDTAINKNYYGSIDSVSKNELFIKVSSMNTYTNSDLCSNSIYETFCDEKRVEVLQLDDIDYIYHQSPVAGKSTGLVGTILIASGITALVVAPLVSINYDTGDFNKDRYYKVAGFGLGGLAVTIPLVIALQGKKYRITTNQKLQSRKHWYFDL